MPSVRAAFTSLGRARRGAALGLAVLVVTSAPAQKWKDMAEDGIHDPGAPAIGVLQEPAEALSVLPRDHAESP